MGRGWPGTSCSAPTVLLGGSTPPAPAPRLPGSPAAAAQAPARQVCLEKCLQTPRTCSPAQLQAQFSLLFNPQINMCSYIFNREAVFIRVGISFTSFSLPLRRHPTRTWKTSRLMKERPGQVRETETATPGRSSPPPGPVMRPCPSFLSPGPTLQPTPAPNSCWRSLCREAPAGPPGLLSTPSH